jgi:RNA polymerase sigma factor FliA
MSALAIDDTTADRLQKEHLDWAIDMAHSIAHQFTDYGVTDRDDLAQDALGGFLRACKKYQPNRGASFHTYAANQMRFAIIDALRQHDHLSRRERAAVTQKLAEKPHEAPLVVEIETRTGKRAVAVNGQHIRHRLTIDEEEPIAELGVDEPGYDAALAAIDVATVYKLLKNPRYRLVLALRYTQGLAQHEVGTLLGVTESRICQLEAAALNESRHLLTDGQRTNTRPQPVQHSILTPRECDVLQHIADGLVVSEIATLLDISIHTVREHLKNVNSRLGAKNQAHSVSIGFQLGLIS